MIHFFPASNPKMVAKLPDLAPKVDVLLANLEDGVPASDKEQARAGLIEVGRTVDFGSTQFWTRVNSLDSPWGLDDLIAAVTEVGQALDVIMIPKVEGAEDIHYVDRLLAQLEAKAGLTKPLQIHAILETARGVANVEEICAASPRMQGLSLGPADLAANRRMKTTRVGGGHPEYKVRQDPIDGDIHGPRRSTSKTCGTTPSLAWLTPVRPTASTPTTDHSVTLPTWSRVKTSSATPICWAASERGVCTQRKSRSPVERLDPIPPMSVTPVVLLRRW
jgi:malyl-CoA/(S)-citramalyl-CoA lyase